MQDYRNLNKWTIPNKYPLYPFVLRLRCLSIDPSFPLIQGPPLAVPQSLLLKVAHPEPADVTSTRRIESCHSMSDTMCMAPRKTGPCSGPYFYWIRILLYIGSFDPLSYVPLSSFRRRPLAPYASFPCYLSFLPSNVTAPSSTLRPPPCFWIQFTKLPSIPTPNFSSNVATQVCLRQDRLHILLFPSHLSPLLILRVEYLSPLL